MGIAVIVTVDSSLNGSRSKQIKISVPSDQEVNILFLRYQVIQELVECYRMLSDERAEKLLQFLKTLV